MKEELENIDDLFRDELKNFSPKPPEGAWANIATKLEAQSAPRKVVPLFWKAAASLLLFISTGSLVYYLLNNKPQQGVALNEPTIQVQKSEPLQKPANNTAEITAIQSGKSNNTKVLAYTNNLDPNKKVHGNSTGTDPITTKEVEESNAPDVPKDIFHDGLPDTRSSDEKIVANNVQTFEDTTAKQRNINLHNFENLPEQNTQNFNWQASDDAVNDQKSNGQWFIGGQGGPQYTYRTVSPAFESDRANPSDLTVNNSDFKEYGTIAYAAGLNVEYKPARKFSIQSGIYYSKYSINSEASVSFAYSDPARMPEPGEMNYQVSSSDVVVRFPNNSVTIVSKSNNTLNGQKVNTIDYSPDNLEVNFFNAADIDNSPEASTNYEYIEIPVIARYALIDKKVNVQLLGGLSTNILIKNYTNVDLGTGLVAEFETEKANTLNYSSTFGFGVGYDLSKRVTMSVEPQFKYFLGSQVYDANNVRPYSLGIYSGVKYRF